MPANILQVSVVIPTFNRVARLRTVLNALEQQAYPSGAYEVIVVSDGSTDGTEAYLESFRSSMRLRWFSQLNQGPAAARNKGLREAQCDLVLFVDDDVVAEPQLLAEHANSHRQVEKDVVVLGPLLTPRGFKMSPWVHWEQEMLMKQYAAMLRGDWTATARQFYTGNASVRLHHLVAAGGFDESFRRAEDVELAYRLADRGLDFVFNMKAAGMHFADRSFRAWLNAARAYGRNDVIFTRDRNQPWLLPAVRKEFHDRHKLVQWLVRFCGGRPLLSQIITLALKGAADSATKLHATDMELKAYSALFNLHYYNGLFEELDDAQFLVRDS